MWIFHIMNLVKLEILLHRTKLKIALIAMEGVLDYFLKKVFLTIPMYSSTTCFHHQHLNLAPTLGTQASVHTVSESNFLSTGSLEESCCLAGQAGHTRHAHVPPLVGLTFWFDQRKAKRCLLSKTIKDFIFLQHISRDWVVFVALFHNNLY